jgi:hypothetical protein
MLNNALLIAELHGLEPASETGPHRF